MLASEESIGRTDEALGAHAEFAASAPIQARSLAHLRLGLAMLAARDPDRSQAFERAIRLDDERLLVLHSDPVLRNSFEEELARVENGAELSGAYAFLLENLAVDDLAGVGPCERLAVARPRPWPARGRTWLWTELGSDPAVHPAFRSRLEGLYRETFGETASDAPLPVTDDMYEALRRGADLLCDLLPCSGAGVLPHVALIGFATDEKPDGQLYSLAGGDALPAAIFMAPHQLADPWTTAETILHEGLHLKLFDVLRTGALVADPEQQVPIPWRNGQWPLVRALFALHVYVHLVLFEAAARGMGSEPLERYGRPPSLEQIDAPTPGSPAALHQTHVTRLDRARYLAEQAEAVYADSLTERGRTFVAWLLDSIESVEPNFRDDWTTPPPTMGRAHPPVMTGRYRRVEPAISMPLPELGQLLVTTQRAPGTRCLNARAWLTYSLCDGGDVTAIEAGYRKSLGDVPGEERETVAIEVRRGLAALVDAGLVEDARAGR